MKFKHYQIRVFVLLGSFLAVFTLLEAFLTIRSLVKYGGIGRQELIRVRSEGREDALGGTGGRDENRQVLHPFFGYTYNPKDKGINNFGFWTSYDISLQDAVYTISNADRRELVVVGIFGGSFAGGIGNQRAYLERRIAELFPNKKPVVMNFGVGGHALPQSALIYIYFKELFDVAVFIDGLNELWNYVENNRAGVPPEYAKAVHYIYKLSREELTPHQFERTSTIVSLKKRIAYLTRFSLIPVLRQSLLVHYIWKVLEGYWSTRIADTSREIVQSYEGRPRFFEQDDEVILAHAARQWAKYHRLVHQLATADGVLSIHLLQPNPFVPGSKRLTPEEKYRVENSFPVKSYVVNGYPKLKEQLLQLRAEGLIVEDLSYAFQSSDIMVWNDSAHLNDMGKRVITDKLIQLIAKNREVVRLNREQ